MDNVAKTEFNGGMRFASALACLLLVVPAAGQTLTQRYDQLLRPALSRAATLEDAHLDWGVFAYHFISGEMDFDAAPGGAAFFQGQATLTVPLPTPSERQQAALLAGKHAVLDANGLTVTFKAAAFRYADGAAWAAGLGKQTRIRPLTAAAPLASLEEDRAKRLEDRGSDEIARLAVALDAPAPASGPGLLLADLQLTDGTWIQAAFDPWQQEPVEVHRWAQTASAGQFVFDDVWTQFAPSGSDATAPYQLNDYQLLLDIPGNVDMNVGAGFHLAALVPTGRLALLRLDANLRVTAASTAAGGAVEWIQPRDPGRERDAWYQGDWLLLQLPQPLTTPGTTVELRYHGKNVITKVGDGNFFCQDFGWYPMDPFGPPFQRASFDMTFQVNHRFSVVATGVRDRNQRDGEVQITHWHTPVPLTVAGFALGDYTEIEQPIKLPEGQAVQVRVFSNNSPDNMLSSINLVAEFNPGIPIGTLDTKRLAPEAMRQVSQALEFMATYFGPYPYAGLSVTPILGNYGQGWPTLLYLSNLSFLDSTQLHELGLPESVLDLLSFTFRAHEVSHQWWGHRISWATPRDQWLSEGFANASAELFAEQIAGPKQVKSDLDAWKRALTERDRFGHRPIDVGALWLGTRLASTADPGAYQILTYDKGGYVLYMLRQMLWSPGRANPDAAFIAMMKDFTSTYANRDATTADFERIAEKHMTPAMDLDRDHSLKWFFDEYVYGTGIDQLSFHSAVVPDHGRYAITLTVDNPDHWRGLLPVYFYRDDKHFVAGLLRVDQSQVSAHLPSAFAPRKIVANAFDDMLVEIKQ